MSILDEYRRVRKNLFQQIRRMEKRGYNIPENYAPDRPKKLKEGSIRKLKKLREQIYKKSTYTDPATGEIVPGEVGMELEKKRRKKGTFDVVKFIEERLTEDFPSVRYLTAKSSVRGKRYSVVWNGEEKRNTLLTIWRNTVDDAISNDKMKNLTRYIKERESMIAEALNIINYDSEEMKVNAAVSTLADLLSPFLPVDDETHEELAAMTDYFNE